MKQTKRAIDKVLGLTADARLEKAIEEYRKIHDYINNPPGPNPTLYNNAALQRQFRQVVHAAAECRNVMTSPDDLRAGILSFTPPKTKIAKPGEQRKIPSLRKVGTKADAKTLQKKSIQDSPEILPEDDVALRAQLTMENCSDIIDTAIREGRELTREERNEIARFHHALQVVSGSLPDPGLNMRYAMPEFLTYMQERAQKTVKDQLKPLCKDPDDGMLKAAAGPMAQERARALSELKLPANETTVTIDQVQKALVALGPNHSKIKDVLTGLGIPPTAHANLRSALHSQRMLDDKVRKANLDIEAINKKREGKEASPKHEAAKKALDEFKSIETWNRLVKDFSPEAKRAGLSSVAALEAARAILSSPTDLKPEDIKDKIGKPVTDASQKDAKAHTDSAQAAQRGAERAIDITKNHLQESKEAQSAASMAINASVVANCILGMTPEEFKGQTFEDGFDGFAKSIETTPVVRPDIGIAAAQGIAEYAKDHKKINVLIEEDAIPEAQKRVSQAAAIAGALFKIPRVMYDDLTAIVTPYLENGVFEEKALNDLITQRFPAQPALQSKILAAIHTAQAVTAGITASNQAVASAKADTEKAGQKLHPAIATAVADGLQSRFEAKTPINDVEIKTIIDRETNRANKIIKSIAEIKLAEIKVTSPDAKDSKESKDLPKKLKDAVIKKYSTTGHLDAKAIEETITPLLPEEEIKPTKEEIVQSFYDEIKTEQSAADPAKPNMSTPALKDIVAVAPTSEKIDAFTKTVTDIYKNIPGKVAHDAAKAIAKFTGVPEAKAKEVANAAQKAIDDGKTPQEAAEAAIKLLGPEHEAAFVPLAAVLSRQVGLPIGNALPATAAFTPNIVQRLDRPAIQKAYAQSRSQAVRSTSAAAIGAAVEETMTRLGVPSTAVTDAVVRAYLDIESGFNSPAIRGAINTAVNSVNAKAAEMLARFTDAYLGLTNPTPKLQDDIKSALIDHYKKNGNLDNPTAAGIIAEKVSAHNNTNPPPPALAQVNLPRASFTEPLPDGQEGLVIGPAMEYKLQDSEEDNIVDQVYKAHLISAGMQAIQGTAKGADKNTRAVAGAVAVTACSFGAPQDEILKWSKTLADHYAKKPADFDKLDSKQVLDLCPELNAVQMPRRQEMVQTLVNAAKAAAGVDPKVNALEAATSVTAKVYPAFDKPREAAAMSTIIAEAHNGKPSDISNASAYAESLGARASIDYSHFSMGAAAAAAAAAAESKGNKAAAALAAAMTLTNPAIRGFLLPLRQSVEGSIAEAFRRDTSPSLSSVAAHVSTTAMGLGLTVDQAKRAASITTHLDILSRSNREDLVSATTVALAYTNALATQESVRTIRRPNIVQAALNGRAAVETRQAALGRNDPWNAIVVEEIANQTYQEAKTASQNANKEIGISKSQLDLVANIAGKSAMLEAYLTAIENSPPAEHKQGLSHRDFEALSAKARILSREISADAEKLKQSFKEGATAGQQVRIDGISIPNPVEDSVVRTLAASAISGNLIHEGITKGLNVPGDANAQTLAAIEAIAEAEKMEPKEKAEFLAAAQKVLENSSNAAEAGALIATLQSFSPEVARSLATVVAHFKTDVPAERAQAIKQAITAASIMMEERASLPTTPADADAEHPYSLDQFTKEEFTKRQQQAAKLLAEMREYEKLNHPYIEDGLGVSEGLKDQHLDDTHQISVKNVGDWTITLNTLGGRGRTPKNSRVADMPELKDFMERMKKCDGYVTAQTLKEAVKTWNATHTFSKIGSKHGNFEDAITKNADGTFDIDLQALSNPQVVEFCNILATQAEADKKKATESPADTARSGQDAESSSSPKAGN